jgi:hypothetical protein
MLKKQRLEPKLSIAGTSGKNVEPRFSALEARV